MRVFDGGVGWIIGGILERSIDIGLDLRDTGRDNGGDVGELDIEDILSIVACRQSCVLYQVC